MELRESGLSARLPVETARKFESLRELLRPLLRDGLIVAFSGGVDSAFLLWAAETERRLSFCRELITLS